MRGTAAQMATILWIFKNLVRAPKHHIEENETKH